eukprot:jgi/Botrbrau1/22660/Bobra.0132s0006.1
MSQVATAAGQTNPAEQKIPKKLHDVVADEYPVPLWKKLFHFLCSNIVAIGVLAATIPLLGHLLKLHEAGKLQPLLEHYRTSTVEVNIALALTLAAALALLYYALKPGKHVYLLDFYCFRPPNRMRVTHDMLINGAIRGGFFTDQTLNFMKKVLEISGLGQDTYLPDEVIAGMSRPVNKSMKNARAESELALFVSIQKLLDKSGLKPKDIDGVICHCTAFNPVPSLSASVVHHFKMRYDVMSYNLAGMGCAASIIAVDLAKEIIWNHPEKRILVCGTENVVMNIYEGNTRNMHIVNLIFRYGGIAAILSGRPSDGRKAKYELQHTVRTHLGSNDEAYNAVILQDDEEGKIGVKIGKELMKVAGKALEINISTLGPKVLPLSEKLCFAANFIARKLGSKAKPYVPDFRTAFDHFCIHPGGKAVIETVGKELRLNKKQCNPMLMPFERYGNTSSCSTWYAWSYVETNHNVRKGDRVWQLGFGSGFKCCSATWRALRNINDKHDAWTEVPSCE